MIKRGVLCISLFAMLSGCMENGSLAPVDELRGVRRPDASAYHIVRSGDTLYSIAFRYDVDYRALARYNHISYPYVLKTGRMIRRPPNVTLRPVNPVVRHPVFRPLVSLKRSPMMAKPVRYMPPKATGWLWPVAGVVRTRFNVNAGRKGIDIAVPKGTAVRAARGGVVAYAGEGLPGYGHLIIIKHDNQWLTAYGNNQRHRVTEGQNIKAGQIIADTGITAGGFSGVHFEIRRHGQPVNPLDYLPAK